MMTEGQCVIFNPRAGRGRAVKSLKLLRRVLGAAAEFWPTQGPGHGEELAFKAARSGFAAIGAAGGDGTVHEVANGLLRAAAPDVVLAVYPIGSANDYAHSLGLDPDWWRHPRRDVGPREVDVGVAQAPDGRQRFFINGLGLGFNAAVTIESRRIHWLRGVPLYSLAMLRALCYRFAAPVMAVSLDGDLLEGPTLALTLAIGRREGNFVLAPNAQVDDGLFDYLHVGPLARWKLLRYLPGMILGRLPTNEPAVRMGRCRQLWLHSREALTVHCDGEFFCLPEDDFRTLEVRILPASLRVVGLLPERIVGSACLKTQGPQANPFR